MLRYSTVEGEVRANLIAGTLGHGWKSTYIRSHGVCTYYALGGVARKARCCFRKDSKCWMRWEGVRATGSRRMHPSLCLLPSPKLRFVPMRRLASLILSLLNLCRLLLCVGLLALVFLVRSTSFATDQGAPDIGAVIIASSTLWALPRLAETYACESGLSAKRRRLLLAAALLHDVGHGPLSHTLEPVFAEAFDIDHHSMTRRIVRGETRNGRDVYVSLRGADLDPDEVLAMIDGHHSGPDAFLFAGSINFDTLDGISRSRAFMKPRAAPSAMLRAVRHWAQTGRAPLSEFDAFWTLKHDVYTLLICGARGRLLDAVAQAYMRANIDEFDASDFERSEATLRKRHPKLFKVLGLVASQRLSSLKDHLPSRWMKEEVTVKDRAFIVSADKGINEPNQLDARYTQRKFTRRISIEELIEGL